MSLQCHCSLWSYSPSFSTGTSIPKGHTEDLSNPSNYRGITVLSNLSKVLEKFTLLRIHLQDPLPSLNLLQGEFRQGHGCVHTAYVLQEAIQSFRDRGKKAYVAFLDVRKAFDIRFGRLVFLSSYARRGLRVISGD